MGMGKVENKKENIYVEKLSPEKKEKKFPLSVHSRIYRLELNFFNQALPFLLGKCKFPFIIIICYSKRTFSIISRIPRFVKH